MLEAGQRIGGRAFTVTPPEIGVPIDLGCEWLHAGPDNAWTFLAEQMGFTVDDRPAPWNDGRDLELSPEDERDYDRTAAAFYGRVAATVAAGQDRAMGDLMDRHDRWRGLFDSISSYVSGTELDHVSCLDHVRYRPGEGPDWRVAEGYGRLIEAYGATIPVALETVVNGIDHAGAKGIRIDTGRGTLNARAVVVTVSTDVLAAGHIRFTPALPGKLAAAGALPLGLANKLFLRVDNAQALAGRGLSHGVAQPGHDGGLSHPSFRAAADRGLQWWRPGTGPRRPRRRAMADFALEELTGLFGAEIRAQLTPVRATAWASEPHILGAYAYARPGAGEARAALAASVDNRLFFAGEATSPHAYTTAHGAYESGLAAANAALESLKTSARLRAS